MGGISLGIGIGEIFVVLLICFFVVGPEDLPKIARTLAKSVKKIRTTMQEITKSFEEDLEMEELKKTDEEIKKTNSEFERIQQEVLKHAKDTNELEQSHK